MDRFTRNIVIGFDLKKILIPRQFTDFMVNFFTILFVDKFCNCSSHSIRVMQYYYEKCFLNICKLLISEDEL
ncbi:hypothetical protein BpHYR1_038203 [Brachionus plicatilis]|uniref:Uncharacterized protein n=1 Tax=Brachionus plicatilis TaxID=10195 RepID=A0A3M7TA49_BRAPC|nr:hypothetical protein BpHYR1_038203 [Brachionus plicatilis]